MRECMISPKMVQEKRKAISQVFSLDGMELLEELEGRGGLGLLWVEKAHPAL